ncbi:MAG: Na(+)-translocating NADH-quinone reductase subunit A [Candidatus Marinimicrobia bacterium]|nr:Na(+)-translocating NADH-quinone reductase subunit A [Candidatus Neomarinimicrobiota bacterium]MBL7009981.1 Na(+)-translocating NADH-quinone reductase subunit A [Candidatus Neomarinimicrobiota bacterium]MBL7029691.1 Na(+)-translocating NADH-quinone reductase subunit A [Candidatus Neomarinimicrobiota bacterium]
MADLNIKKGHNIRISGVPSDELQKGLKPKTVAIQPTDFRTLRPKILVKEGDTVKIGSPLFHCKTHFNVFWPSPGAGTVSSIQFGPRRVVEKIIIELAETEESECHDSFRAAEIPTLGKEQILSALLKGNLIPFIRQRPFNKVVNPMDTPRDIFISGWNTAPLSVNLDVILRRRLPQFQAGINILKKLTTGSVHLSINENTVSDTLLEVKGADVHTLNGPHPVGNVGIQIHHIAPLKLNDLIWTVNAQDVVRIGTFFLTGKYDPTIFVTAGGPGVKTPTHIKTRMGVRLDALLSEKLNEGKQRIISGDVLTGKTATKNGYLGFYDSTISVIPEGGEREFMGMIKPGSSLTRYSLTNAFIGFGKKFFSFNTLQNGSERYMVPINAWEDALPMDILPNALYRAIHVEDIEEMEQLGIIECDEEDFALCSFACPSKIDVGGMIRQGLNLMEKEV